MKNIKILLIALFTGGMMSCKYLDVVPDNIATVEYAFRLRSQAEKYLFTCYSYMPGVGSPAADPGMLSGDETWFFYPYQIAYYGAPPDVWEVARGNQNISNPYYNYWDGEKGGKPLFQGIRDCNTFLENIHLVPDMDEVEKNRWIAEVKFLKAYYHWFLLRMYGPIPITDVNMPISTNPADVKVYREPVDSVFNYVIRQIDEAAAGLPETIVDQVSEIGRVTRPIALALKAKVLITAASPMFNGNSDYANFTDKRGIHLFNTAYDESKWKAAADALKQAIDAAHENGYKLYLFNQAVNTLNLGPVMQKQMDLRNAITEKWNSEIIWGANNSMVDGIQRNAQPILSATTVVTNGTSRPKGEYAPTMKIAEMFYTKNGLPINEDKDWNYAARYQLQTATTADKYYIQPNYTTAKLNFDREPRFYADLGFDGGIWFGQGNNNQESAYHVEGKVGQYSGRNKPDEHSITGYYDKKLVSYLNVSATSGVYTVQAYPFPAVRLADLYLYYAEALNETGDGAGAMEWINKVRERAGIPTVQDSWTNYSNNPSKFQSKDGLREIIQQERLIEMAFEGARYWDLLRWKKAETVINMPVRGWNISQQETNQYYQPVVLFNQGFKKRNYLWPLKESAFVINNNLVQNPGW